jgi:hypothetical protein
MPDGTASSLHGNCESRPNPLALARGIDLTHLPLSASVFEERIVKYGASVE